jgi:hypothetical protein
VGRGAVGDARAQSALIAKSAAELGTDSEVITRTSRVIEGWRPALVDVLAEARRDGDLVADADVPASAGRLCCLVRGMEAAARQGAAPARVLAAGRHDLGLLGWAPDVGMSTRCLSGRGR